MAKSTSREAYPPPVTWEPIETSEVAAEAKVDGRDLLVVQMPGGRQLVARWLDNRWIAVDTVPVEPTHCQPLPALPDAKVAGPLAPED